MGDYRMHRRRRGEPQTSRPMRHASPSKQKRFFASWTKLTTNFEGFFSQLFNPASQNLAIYSILFSLAFDTLLSYLIVRFRPYTEIDWSTYMQQVECYVKGEKNYSNIYGDTGPIVYPAGHLHVYHFLYRITEEGKNILKAQYLFMMIYLFNQATVYYIFYQSRRIPPFLYFFVTLFGYRIHSIYMLRLFNDGIAMLFCYFAIALLISIRDKSNLLLPILSSLSFSMAIGIKMNILLFAPVFYLTFLFHFGYLRTFVAGILAAFLQLFLGSPFLFFAPSDYIKNAFNFKRVFLYVWTVNWRMIPEWLFLDRRFHTLLLGLHLLTLAIFIAFFWIRIHKKNLNEIFKIIKNPTLIKLSNHDILIGLFVSNFIGIAFSRSLHYQFYSWYYHTIPYILFSWRTRKEKTADLSSIIFGAFLRLFMMVIIEYCWNTYPSTILSSTLLSISHVIMLGISFWNA